ncbi:MAG: tRNA glutamyl-Q(34) synthetase GluQRS [Planctomycetota bacterium]
MRGRLAPSPTGALHLGNARTFLLAWLSLRAQGGTVVLRIEDLDGPRIKPAATQSVIEDLHWLGLDWDEGPDVGGPWGPYLQTERGPLYEQAFERLRAAGVLYPCGCSRSDIERAASAPHPGEEGPRYPGTCRPATRTPSILPPATELPATELPSTELPATELTPAVAATGGAEQGGRSGAAVAAAWRFLTPTEPQRFTDGRHGPQVHDLQATLGDFVVRKANGTPAYQLAVVVDDAAMRITEVVRGDDLLSSTPRQLLIYRTLNWEPPQFYHVPRMIGPDGRRLAKRHGDSRLAMYREAGLSPERLVGQLASSMGLLEPGRECQPRDLIARFDWDRIQRQPTVCHPLDWLPSRPTG